MFPHFKKNIETLKKLRSINSADKVLAWLSSSPGLEIVAKKHLFQNQQGFTDWKISENKELFGNNHPQDVYSSWLPLDKANYSATIVIGTNLGYGINILLKQTPHSHRIIVIDPKPEFVFACLSFTDYQEYIAQSRLILLPPLKKSLNDILLQFDLQAIFGKIFIKCDPMVKQLDEAYSHWTNYVTETAFMFSATAKVTNQIQDKLVENELANFKLVLQSGNLKLLYNAGIGVRAVSLGAGPSLTHIGPEIAKICEHSLVISSIQTLASLQKINLKPDLCVGLDYSNIMMKLYENLDLNWCKDIPLIYASTLSTEVLKKYPGPKISFWTPRGVGDYLFGLKRAFFHPGSSVGVTQFRLLQYFGVKSILLAGMDLGWTGKTTHASGHLHESENLNFQLKKNIKLISDSGKIINSHPSFIRSIREIEEDVKKYKLVCYNLQIDGADIANVKNVSLKEAVDMDLFISKSYPLIKFKKAVELAIESNCNYPYTLNSKPLLTQLKTIKKWFKSTKKNPTEHSNEIKLKCQHILSQFQQGSVYGAYVYKELLEISRLIHFLTTYNIKDIDVIQKIIQSMINKITIMDEKLT